MKQISIRAALILMCLVLFATSCGTASEKQLIFDSEKSYKDIPGITQEEISAIETLKAKKISFLYGHLATTEAFALPDGTRSGFVYEFCDLLTNLFGIEFIPDQYESWEHLKSDFDKKTVDFIGDLTPTPERTRLYYMTHAIAERSLRIFTRADSGTITAETDISGLKIGFFTGTITAESIKKSYKISFEAVDFDSFSNAAEKLESGDIDAFVMETIADPAFENYDFIVSKEFFPLVYNPVSLSTANADLAPVISAMNKYILAGGIDKLYELYEKGDYEYTKYKLEKSFTDEEKAYIADLKTRGAKVMVAYEHDNYPVSFYNEEDKQTQGIAVDVLDEINRLTGIEFESIAAEGTAWDEIMAKLKYGEAAMVTELIYSDARAKDFIWAGTPVVSSYYALLSKTGHPDLSPQQVIRETVGAMRGSIYEDMYNTWFPNNNNLYTYSTQTEALDALEKGEIDLMMATELMLLTQTNYRENPGYKVNICFNTEIDSLFGFNKNEVLLRSIVDKSMSFINIEAIDRSWTTRTFDYSTKMANMRAGYTLIFAVILFIILMVIMFFLIKTKRLGKELARQTEEARIASKAKTTFLAHMSHEIRTPLNAIIGMSSIAKNSIDNHAKAVSSIDQIITSSNHLLGVLNDVLDMSKIESGKLEIVQEPFSLLESYGDVSNIITQRCMEKNINFVTNINRIENITLIGDKLRINQVLINLLGNAVKFTRNAGRIKFSVDILEETDESIRIGYSVSDTGIGMSVEQLSKLFVPFEQATNLTAAKFGGTGLGLAISQNLINMMGGEIKVESMPNVGSKFYFELCFEKGIEADETTPETPESVDLTGKRILLVEDIDINRIIVKEILSTTGVEIDEAEDGRQAMDIFERSSVGHYALIFMDVQMPVMDGYEATRQIRKLEREDAKRVPIIAMTANAYKEDVDNAVKAGMNGHLSKPINVDELMRILADFIP